MSESGFNPQEQVTVSPADTIERLKWDPEFAIQFCEPEALTESVDGVPDFHIDCLAEAMDDARGEAWLDKAWALPRGHGKSFLLRICVALRLALGLSDFAVYVSNTAGFAAAFVRDIWRILTSDNFLQVFGEIRIKIERPGEGHFEFWWGDRKVILKALGTGQHTRGLLIENYRPDLMVIDDAETKEVVESEVEQESLRTWIYSTLFKAGNARKLKKLWAANLLSDKSITYDITHNSPLWKARVYGSILANGRPLWPYLWTIEKLKADMEEYRRIGKLELWLKEMQNDLQKITSSLLDHGKIQYEFVRNRPEDYEARCIIIDPATGEGADDTAIVVHGLLNGRWVSIDWRCGKMKMQDAIEQAVELALYWQVPFIGVESVGFQKVMIQSFQLWLNLKNITGIEIVPLTTQGKAKMARIMAWCGMIEAGDYALRAGDVALPAYLSQIDPNKDNNRDDLADGHAGIIEMRERYEMQIISASKRHVHLMQAQQYVRVSSPV